MIKLKLEKQMRYVIGVSGGPDSMALLDMCRRQNYDVIAVHMNYAKRDSADRDEAIIRTYCAKYGIPCVIRKQNKECIGNFQAFAREQRYALYQAVLQDYGANAVLLAHHLDDHLETYVMQKKRQSTPEYYGIAKQVVLLGCCVMRPLLELEKRDLVQYCEEHKVTYGIDESNLSDDYTRNQIRHTLIEHMDTQAKHALAMEIKQVNISWEIEKQAAKTFLKQWSYDVESLRLLDENKRCLVLFLWIWEELQYAISITLQKHLSKLLMHENGWSYPLKDGTLLCASYGVLELIKAMESYAYVMHTVEEMTTPYFQIVKQGKTIEGVTLYEEDFPITIRNVQKGDAIRLRFGTKKVHRWFIDRKISQKERKSWPVLVNVVGNVVFVPGIGCDIEHFSNNPNVFVLK